MALPLYLAQTSWEMREKPQILPFPAYMSCHFSSWGKGLSNLPQVLPEGTMLILDDSVPFSGHDPGLIYEEITHLLAQHRCGFLLLDFQQPDEASLQDLTALLCRDLPCPVGVSSLYARGLDCPVFLPPVPPDIPLKQHLKPWTSREIWLEAALDGCTLLLDQQGCASAPLEFFPETGLTDDTLHCHYLVQTGAQNAVFSLWRTRADLDALLNEAETLGVSRAVGLWQELGNSQ